MSAAKSSRKSGKKGAAGKGGPSGSRCSIYDEIDGLSDCLALPEAKRFPTFIAAMQGILNQMAYYVVNSDGAVLEDTEHWHTTFSNRLYEAAGQARTEAAERRAPAGAAAPGGPALAAPASASGMAPMPVRQAAGNIPASLRRILEGSHESLRDDDDDPP